VGRLWHLLDALTPALHRDIAARTGGAPARGPLAERPGARVHPSVVAVRPERIHLAAGVTVKAGAVLSAEDGPIYLGAGATVHEQAVVRGPLYLGPHGHVRIGANVATSAFGPYTKVGGEVHSTIVQGYTNKAHAGFLGHSLLGQWCNLGADTNNSNLKNDYGPVSLYHAPTGTFEDTGRQFLGLVMGDHGKAGINTMFNTGTVVGTCCNVYGGGFPPRALPPFAWGSPDGGFATYRLGKALRVAEAVMARRDTPLTPADRALLTHVFETTARERREG
jgi:UDP-N-acetylglucosamine diphosphorylase/glucosamine-1-phosphate N-acetyltransferase